MTQDSHLDTLLGDQPDPIALRLMGEFKTIWRRLDVSQAEYSTKLRNAMDQLLEDLDATPESESA